MNKVVSVIVPIYNVRNFIARCAESLMAQTLEGVQYIFVNDCTQDDSIEVLESILEKYPEKDTHIIHHEVNLGLPSARNSGLAVAEGEYIFHCDGDDWIEPDMLELLVSAAEENNADITYCDFFLSYHDYERHMATPDFTSGIEMLKNGLLAGTMKYNVWNKLLRRNLYLNSNILFPEGHSMGEDMTIIMLTACAKTVCHVNKALYHYVQTNTGAMSKSIIGKWDDIEYNVQRVCSFLNTRYENIESEIAFFKLSIKLPILISEDKTNYTLWRQLYPESNKYIFKNPNIPFRTKFLQWCALRKLDFMVRIYNILVYRMLSRTIANLNR